MNNSNTEFDRRIRAMLEDYAEPADERVWDGIVSGLERRRRLVLWRRAAAVGAAAVLALGWFLAVPRPPQSPVQEASRPSPALQAQRLTPQESRPDRPVTAAVSAVPVPEETPAGQPGDAASRMPVRNDLNDPMRPAVQPEEHPAAGPSGSASVPERNTDPVSAGRPAVRPASEPGRTPQEVRAENLYLAASEAGTASRTPWSLGLRGDLSAASKSVNGSIFSPYLGVANGQGPQQLKQGIVPLSSPRHSLPLSFGVQVRIPLNDRFSIGTGVTYSLLQSRYEALYNNALQVEVDQRLHFIGVPLEFYATLLESRHLDFYAHAGGMLEKGITARYSLMDLERRTTYKQESVDGVQWSVNLGMGLEYRFVSFAGIYVDPSLVYYFRDGQPLSMRSEQPLQLKMEVGMRFRL